MAAVSQALVEFANHHRQPPGPGIEVVETPRYRITLQPDYPVPGPNNASWIRCGDGDPDDLIREVREVVKPRHLPIMWTLDPDTEPVNFAAHLAAVGVMPEGHADEVAVMVLGVDAAVDPPSIPRLELHDALADAESFRMSDAVNAEAFGEVERGVTPEQAAAQERRRANQLAAGNRRVVLARSMASPRAARG